MSSPDARFLNRATPPKVITLILMAGLSALTMNIFLPSLPSMAIWFDAPYALMQLSVALYLLLSAALQVMIGPLSDHFGRRPVLLTALVIFLIATAGTLLAPDATSFLVFRMMQAVIAAGMVLSRAIVKDVTTDPGQAASMIGYVTMGMTLVPMIGPVAGGYLDEFIGWQANFGLLMALGLLVLWLIWADLGETAPPASGGVFQQFARYPALLRSGTFWGYTLCAAFASGCFFAYLGGAPYVGNQVFGLTSSQIGKLFALTAVGYASGNFIAGRFSARVGLNRMVLIGTLATSLGLAVLTALTLAGMSGPVVFFGLTIAMGLGNGMSLPNANAGMLTAFPQMAGSASGLGGAIMIGGGAALAALAGFLLPPGSSEVPLVLLMLTCSLASNAAILALIARKNRA